MQRAKYISNGTITYKIVGDQGPQGAQGPKGDTGKSAYQIAVDNGFVGTESEWLESLKCDLDIIIGLNDYLSHNLINEDALIDRTYINVSDGTLKGESKDYWFTTYPIDCRGFGNVVLNGATDEVRYRLLARDRSVIASGRIKNSSPIDLNDSHYLQICFTINDKNKLMLERGVVAHRYTEFNKIDIVSSLSQVENAVETYKNSLSYNLINEDSLLIGVYIEPTNGIIRRDENDNWVTTNNIDCSGFDYVALSGYTEKDIRYRLLDSKLSVIEFGYLSHGSSVDNSVLSVSSASYLQISYTKNNLGKLMLERGVEKHPYEEFKRLDILTELGKARPVKENILSVSASGSIDIAPKIIPFFDKRNNDCVINPTLAIEKKDGSISIKEGAAVIGNTIKNVKSVIKRSTYCFKNNNTDMIKDPEIHYENGKYYMFLTGIDSSDNWEIQYAVANDIEGEWTYGGTALTLTGAPTMETTNLWAPTLIKKDGLWYMYILNNPYTYLATSSSLDGVWSWNVNFKVKAFDGHVFEDDGLYYLVYTNGQKIMYRTSTDLINWSNDYTVMFECNTQAWQEGWTEAPYVVKKEGLYYCFYGSAPSQSKQRIGVAVSSALDSNFVDIGQINMLIPESCKNSIAHPCVVEKNGFYYLYFCGTSAHPSSLQGGAENFRIFRYKSIDLLNWTPVDYETSYHGDSEIIYMNTCGDLEYTTEVQNQQFYPLACATNKEIKILLPYLKGENILLNPCFDADVNNWEIGNENWADSSIYTGTMVKNLDSTITQIGFNNSCKLTSTGQRTRSCIKQTSSLECEIGDYIANIAYVNNNSCRKVILTTHILDMNNNIILSYDNTVTGNNGWIPIVNILKVPSKKTDGSMYFGRYKVRTQVCVDIDDGQSLNVSNIQVFKINRALLS